MFGARNHRGPLIAGRSARRSHRRSEPPNVRRHASRRAVRAAAAAPGAFVPEMIVAPRAFASGRPGRLRAEEAAMFRTFLVGVVGVLVAAGTTARAAGDDLPRRAFFGVVAEARDDGA